MVSRTSSHIKVLDDLTRSIHDVTGTNAEDRRYIDIDDMEMSSPLCQPWFFFFLLNILSQHPFCRRSLTFF